MSAAEKDAVWTRFRAGESFTAIGRAVGKPVGSIYGIVRLQGGIAPPRRRRAAHSLTSAEREGISRGLSAGASVRAIARALARAPSTISREISRNGGSQQYRALDADGRAWQQAKRPKRCRLARTASLRVIGKLRANWSPAQIAGWLMREYPDHPEMRVSHETIYRTSSSRVAARSSAN